MIVKSLVQRFLAKNKSSKQRDGVKRNNGLAEFQNGQFIVHNKTTLVPVYFSLSGGRLSWADVGFFVNDNRLCVYIEQLGNEVENILTHAEEVITVAMNSFAHDVPLDVCDFILTTSVIVKRRKESFVLARFSEHNVLAFHDISVVTEKNVRDFVNIVKQINVPG